jgi:hypothetical protein
MSSTFLTAATPSSSVEMTSTAADQAASNLAAPPTASSSSSSSSNKMAQTPTPVNNPFYMRQQPDTDITVATFNVSAINRNPLEFHLLPSSLPPAVAAKLTAVTTKAEAFLRDPDNAAKLGDIFPVEWARELAALCAADKRLGIDPGALQAAAKHFDTFLAKPAVSGFFCNGALAAKRMTAWPDRFTNTIVDAPAASGAKVVFCRPSVINGYDRPLVDGGSWWAAWKTFMFDTTIEAATGKRPVDLLRPLTHAKYEAVTPEEEAMSLPLQVFMLAAFDAFMVRLSLLGQRPSDFSEAKAALAKMLVDNKAARLRDIIYKTIMPGCSVIGLQECTHDFINCLEERLPFGWMLIPSEEEGADLTQFSAFLIDTDVFDAKSVQDALLPESVAAQVADGSLMAVTAVHAKTGAPVCLASWHDVGGGAHTLKVLAALKALECPHLVLLADTNAVRAPKKKALGLAQLQQAVGSYGWCTAWSPGGPEATTFKARSLWNAQPGKAVWTDEIATKADIESKDTIITSLRVVRCATVDNTGAGVYEHSTRPSPAFPSDHGIVRATLRLSKPTTTE